jgi:predicted DNA-binding WGR domain protein
MREWGRIGSAGTVRETWYDSEAEALGAGEKLLAQKTKRGYQRIGNGF